MTPPELDWPEYCVDHFDAPAISICTHCGAFICRDCRRIDAKGLARCGSCEELGVSKPLRARLNLTGALRWFFGSTRAALFQPARFIKELDLRGPLVRALVFGLICTTIGQIALPLWALLLNSSAYGEFVTTSADTWGVTPGRFQVLIYTLMPFASVVLLTCYALLIRVGVALAGVRTAYTYRDYLLLASFASVGYLLRLIPPVVVGLALSITYFVAFCMFALWYHHGLSRARTFIAGAPLLVAVFLLELGGGL